MAKLGIGVIKLIGRELGVLYDEIVAEGVPERFAAILRRLDEPAEAGATDEPTLPPERSPKDASSSTSESSTSESSTEEQERGDDEPDLGGENHERLGQMLPRALSSH
jgi:hypothetical protein